MGLKYKQQKDAQAVVFVWKFARVNICKEKNIYTEWFLPLLFYDIIEKMLLSVFFFGYDELVWPHSYFIYGIQYRSKECNIANTI